MHLKYSYSLIELHLALIYVIFFREKVKCGYISSQKKKKKRMSLSSTVDA